MAFTFAESRMKNDQNTFNRELRDILPSIRAGTQNRNRLGLLVANYSQSDYYRPKFEGLLNTRKKEIETIDGILYQDDYPPNVQRVIGTDDNDCLLRDDFVILYDLEILPENTTSLGKY